MRAREMFKEVGLKYVTIKQDEEEVIEIKYSDVVDNSSNCITINKGSVKYTFNNHQFSLETIYLPAIIQQYKELGWLDD